MQNLVKAQLAAALVAALGISLHGAPSMAADDAGASAAPEKKATKTTKTTKKSTKTKTSKEASCKGKEGSCKGKEGSCKGKEGSCKSAK